MKTKENPSDLICADLAGCRNIIQAAKDAGCENKHQIIGFLARQVLDLRATRQFANDGQKEALWHIADIMREHDNQGKDLLLGSTAFKSVKRYANSALNIAQTSTHQTK